MYYDKYIQLLWLNSMYVCISPSSVVFTLYTEEMCNKHLECFVWMGNVM